MVQKVHGINKRENWIDWTKAIAIYAVVLGHVVNEQNDSVTKCITTFLTISHIPLFFFVSGYLFKIKEQSFIKFLISSIKRLIVPYLFFNIASACVLWKLQSHDTFILGFKDFLIGGGYSFAGPAWFLIALFIIRLVCYGLDKIYSDKIKWIIVILLAIGTFLPPLIDVFCVHWALVSLPYFFLGKEIKKNNLIQSYNNKSLTVRVFTSAILTIITCMLLYADGSYRIGMSSPANPLYYYFRVFIAMSMKVTISLLFNDLSNRIIQLISSVSIVIMGFHLTFIQIMWAYGHHLPDFLNIIFESPFISITAFLISLVTAIILKKCCPILIGNRK